ncbi:MAG: PP0621 family protein [Alcaligenaceae bacterium]
MGKALFWVTIFIVGIFIMRLLAIQAAKKRRPPPQAPSTQGEAPANSESMVRCAHCGVHLPRSEASLIAQNTWCSPAHAQLGVRDRD